MRTYIVIGSNSAPQVHLPAGAADLVGRAGVQILACSSVYASEDVTGVAAYWNAALALETSLDLFSLRDLLKQVEDGQGRLRVDSDGHKSKIVSFDADIVLYGDLVRHEKPRLPHPDLRRFAHVVFPVLEIAPDLRLPDDNGLLSALSENLNKALLKRLDSFKLFRKL